MFHYKNITSKEDGAAVFEAPAQPGTVGKSKPKIRRHRPSGRLFWIAVLLVILAAGGWYVWQAYLAPTPPAVPDTVAVTRGDIQQTVLANGILQAKSLVSVGAQVSGRIEKLDVKVGDTVRQGQLIAEIDPSDQQNAVKSAQAQLDIAEAQLTAQQATVAQDQAALDRINTLVAKGVGTRADQGTAQATLAVAKAQINVLNAQIEQARLAVDNANLNLNRTRITAPSDGTVVAVLVDQGQTVNATQTSPTIVKLADVSTMEIKAQISEADVPRVKPGQAVYFTILGDPDNRISAKLLSIDPAPDSIATDSDTTTPSTTNAIYYNGLFQVPNPDGKLRIDMTANVTIILAESKDALIVPASALTKTPRGDTLARVYDPATGEVTPHRVKVGIDNNVTAEILSGLNEGDLVVANGVSFGRQGAAANGKSASSQSGHRGFRGRFGRGSGGLLGL